MYALGPRYSEYAPGWGNVARKSDHSRKYGHYRLKAGITTSWIAGTWQQSVDPPQSGGLRAMAGAMRKMAVYLGLVEDDGYDGRGFDPDDDFEPELDPEPERDLRRREPSHQPHGSHQSHQSHQPHQSQRDESVRVVQPSAPRDPVPH